MNRIEKYNNLIDDIREEAEKVNCRIAHNSSFGDNRIVVAFVKSDRLELKRVVYNWDKKEHQFVKESK